MANERFYEAAKGIVDRGEHSADVEAIVIALLAVADKLDTLIERFPVKENMDDIPWYDEDIDEDEPKHPKPGPKSKTPKIRKRKA